jgi:hypothetical protein
MKEVLRLATIVRPLALIAMLAEPRAFPDRTKRGQVHDQDFLTPSRHIQPSVAMDAVMAVSSTSARTSQIADRLRRQAVQAIATQAQNLLTADTVEILQSSLRRNPCESPRPARLRRSSTSRLDAGGESRRRSR